MRRRLEITLVGGLILALFATVRPVAEAWEQSLQEMIARADAARVEEQPLLYLKIAERQLNGADQLYRHEKNDEAKPLLADVELYSTKAQAAALKSGKRVKDTEIALRKMATKLRDIKRSLSFEDQEPVQAAADHLENLRDELLSHLFGKESK